MAEPAGQPVRRGPVRASEIVGLFIAVLLLLDLFYDVLPFFSLSQLLGAAFGSDSDFAVSIFTAGLVLLIVWLVLRIVGRVFERTTRVRFGTHAQARSVWRLISYIIWAVVILAIVLWQLRDIAVTVVSAAVFAAALAFVLQKPLLNIAAWVVITYQRMYRIGDRVALGKTRGYVTDIGVNHTVMREFGEWMQGDTFT
ncbi:MAG: mechanosensitive ion channel family protein, partial [Thermoplasmata archaeon]|nr:mechanosensitive ion channel family protein [Thermoplasmata archaeon]